MDKKFYTSNGDLTTYDLACGYIEQKENNGIRVTLYKEHNTYHVRGYDFNNHWRLFWDCFDNVIEARKRYKAWNLVPAEVR